MEFLCDSGADTSVLKEEVPNMWPQTNTIFVKSANGQIDQRPVSKPLEVKDDATGVATSLPFVLIKNCPVNRLKQQNSC